MTEEQDKDIFVPRMPVVPDTWEALPFAKAVKTASDRGKKIKKKDYLQEGKIPVIDQGQEFIGGYTDDDTMAYDGELPVILFGDHTRAFKYVDKPFAVGADGVKILKPSPDYDPKFFYYLLRSLQIPSRGYSRHFQFLKKFHLPLAPREQQQRIVAEIEKQFSRLDEAVANLKRVKANLKRHKAAVLKAAVEGKLTEEWRKAHPDVEPTSKLFDRILAERRAKWEEAELAKMEAKGKAPKNDKWKAKYKEPVGAGTADLFDLPKDWGWVCLDALLLGIEAGKSFKCEERPPRDDEVGVLKVSAVTWGTYDELESKTCTRADYVKDDLFVQRGDFLFSRANTIDLVGACVLVESVTKRIMLSDKILRLTFAADIAQWVLFCLRSRWGRFEIERLATGNQESMRNIGQERIRRIRIPLPPIKEIQEVVGEIARLQSAAEVTTGSADSNLRRAGSLKSAILGAAFSASLA